MSDIPIRLWPREHRGLLSSTFRLLPRNVSSASPYSGQVSAYGGLVQRWVAELEFPKKIGPEHRLLQAWIEDCAGVSGLVRMTDYYAMRWAWDVERSPGNQSFSDGTNFTDGTGFETGMLPAFMSIVESSAAGDSSIVINTTIVSQSKVASPGDCFEILPSGAPARHGHFYKVMQYANTNEEGKTRVRIAPRLRAGVMPGDQIAVRAPTSVFKLADDGQGAMRRAMGNIGTFALSLREHLPEGAA